MIFETHFKIFFSPVHEKRNYNCLVCVSIVNIFFLLFFWPKNLEILVIISNFACEIVVDELYMKQPYI